VREGKKNKTNVGERELESGRIERGREKKRKKMWGRESERIVRGRERKEKNVGERE